jgi:hypothetical protein
MGSFSAADKQLDSSFISSLSYQAVLQIGIYPLQELSEGIKILRYINGFMCSYYSRVYRVSLAFLPLLPVHVRSLNTDL